MCASSDSLSWTFHTNAYKLEHILWRTCQLHFHSLVKILIVHVLLLWLHHWHSCLTFSFTDVICPIVLRRLEVLKQWGKKHPIHHDSVSLEKVRILYFRFSNSHHYYQSNIHLPEIFPQISWILQIDQPKENFCSLLHLGDFSLPSFSSLLNLFSLKEN